MILVLTRRCDRRCGFCPQSFERRDLQLPVLDRALAGRPPAVKLFGGEPTLRFDLVQAVVERSTGVVELATHGGRLEGARLEYLRRHPEVLVRLGAPAPAAARLPNVALNLVIRPGESAEAVLARLTAAGVRRVNVLPAYYVQWSEAELAGLRRTLAALARLRRRYDFENARRRGRVPLYNDDVVVDVDGGLYRSNLILVRGARKAAHLLKVGGPPDGPERALELLFTPEQLESSRRVDAELTRFAEQTA